MCDDLVDMSDAIEIWHLTGEISRLRAVNAELVKALDDLLSWFPNEPSKPLWQLTAGEYGADEAVEAARTTLSKAKGEA